MQINTSSWEFSDYIVCFLLQSILEKNSTEYSPNSNPVHVQLIEAMDRKSLKSTLMSLLMRMNPSVKNKYAFFREVFKQNSSSINFIKVAPSVKKLNEEVKLDISKRDVVDEAVKVTTQILKGKHNLNEKKLEELQHRVFEYLQDNDKL